MHAFSPYESLIESIFIFIQDQHTLRGRPYMTSDGRGEGGGSAKSDFISKGSLIKHLMKKVGGSKNGKNH